MQEERKMEKVVEESNVLNIICTHEDDRFCIETGGSLTNGHTQISLQNASPSSAAIFLSSKKNVRPILVGYAFGKKKMRSMGIIMAEASKALSTIITTAVLDSTASRNQEVKTMNISCSDVETLSEREERINENKTTQEYSDEGRLSEININFTNKMDAHSLSSDTLHPSLVTPTTSFSLGSGTYMKNMSPHIVSSSSTYQSASSISSKSSTASETEFYGIEQGLHMIKSNNQKHIIKSIRVSFVPLDLDSPLEEQHGGKFDVILHKLTEDILCISKLSPDILPTSMKSNHMHLSNKYYQKHQKEQERKKNQPSSQSKSPHSNLDESQMEAIARLERLINYKKNHPYCSVVDHPVDIKALMCRADMIQILSNCLEGVLTTSGIPVRTPLFFLLNDNNNGRATLNRLCNLGNENITDVLPFSYPFMSKPLTAAGTSHSHKMGIILNQKGIQHLKLPCLLQDYSNHDGVLYKVYVLGDTVQVFSRKSLPNLPRGECVNENYAYIEFDSQKPYPTLKDFGVHEVNQKQRSYSNNDERMISRAKKRKSDKLEELLTEAKDSVTNDPVRNAPSFENSQNFSKLVTADEIRPLASIIQKCFGLQLFGFDILVKSESEDNSNNSGKKEMFVVDVNYFPSYKEISSFPSLLAQYLTQKAIEGRLKSFQSG